MAGTEEIFEERITKNFPNFMVDTNPEDQETQRKKNKTKKYIKSFHLQTAKNKTENLQGKQRDKHYMQVNKNRMTTEFWLAWFLTRRIT